MGDSRRSEFVRRLSTVGMGTRESIQVLLGSVVHNVREHVVQHRYAESEMDAVAVFHDSAEALWRDTLSTDPPLEPQEIITRLSSLRDVCTGALGDYYDRLDRGLRNAERFEQERSKDG